MPVKEEKLSQAERERIELGEKYGLDGIAAGCPYNQMENFLRAQVFLQPKQLEFAAKARLCDYRCPECTVLHAAGQDVKDHCPDCGPTMVMLAGGRGSAKSHAVLAQIFCDDCQRMPGLKCLFLRKVGQANKEQVSDFVAKLLVGVKHKYKESPPPKLEFDNGSFVILGHFKDEKDIDNFLGLEYDLIYIMESNQLTQSKKIAILSCLRTNKANWRPRCYQDTNPGGIDHVANKRIFVDPWKAGNETETRYIHSTVDDNRFVDPGYKAFLKKLVGWQRESWLNGSWEFMAGSFFSNFYPDVHVYPNPQTDLNEKAVVRWFAGLDYGFSHPSAFVLCCEDENGQVFAVAIYSACNTIIEEHSANIRDLLSLHHLDVVDLEFIAAGRDCFRVDKEGSTVATEYEKHDIHLTPVHIDRINAWSQVAEMFGDVQNQIKPRCFIHRNCDQLINQIQAAQSDPKKPNDILKMNAEAEKYIETGEGGDDLLEAFRNSIVMAHSSLITMAHALPVGSFKSLTQPEPDANKPEDEAIDIPVFLDYR